MIGSWEGSPSTMITRPPKQMRCVAANSTVDLAPAHRNHDVEYVAIYPQWCCTVFIATGCHLSVSSCHTTTIYSAESYA